MSQIVDFPSDERGLEKAGEWLILLEEHALSVPEQAEFKLWLGSSRQNIAAFEEVARVWGKMEILAGMAELFPLDSLEIEQTATGDQANLMGIAAPGVRWLSAVAAILVLAITSIFGVDQYGSSIGGQVDNRLYVTGVGETETIDLEDGSVITANTNSELRIAVTEDERRIELDRGEAFFEVEQDPNRPFTVYAGKGYVRAVGTAFSVYDNGDRVEVIVTEGAVEIISNGLDALFGETDKPILLESGQIARYDETVELVEAIDPEDISRQLFWKEGMLAFEGQSLEEVVDEFSRYTTTDIEIVSDDIRQIRVGGYFQSDDLNGMLAALESNFGIRVTEINPSLVHLGAM